MLVQYVDIQELTSLKKQKTTKMKSERNVHAHISFFNVEMFDCQRKFDIISRVYGKSEIMKKRTKRILIVVGIILILVGGVLGFAGNYFYSLAIDSTTDKSKVFGNSEDDPIREEQRLAIYETFMNHGKDSWITNTDGYRLHAYEANQEGHNWLIAIHGYMGEGKDQLSVGNRFYDMGYQVLVPDLRSHGQSEGTAIGMGAWDSEDIVEWIDYILAQDKEAKIVLYGVSMGASTVMMTTGHKLPDQVKVAVEDCGYTSAWDEFSFQLNELFGLPTFPALDAANMITMLRAGYNLKDADALAAVKKSKTPTLFIHGDADDFVPAKMVHSLYDAAACKKELLIIKGAGHAQSSSVDPDTYWQRVDAFINQYMK